MKKFRTNRGDFSLRRGLLGFCMALALGGCGERPQVKAEPDGNVVYDLVISGGRVMDPETGFDKVSNVGIKDGMIVKISPEKLTGKETVDAKGQVVAPGFIDTHLHWQRVLGYKIGARDGMTSALDIELGALGTKIDEWYAMREGKSPINFGTGSSHELARAKVLDGTDTVGDLDAFKARSAAQGWSKTQPNLDQGNEILKILDEGLMRGALGISSTLGYMREGASTREVYEAQKVAARWGRQYQAHTRYTPDDADHETNGAQEILANAVALGAPAVISHFNNPGWHLVHELITELRAKGHNVWGEVYPYAAGSTTLNAVFLAPENWVDRLGHRYEDTLQDPHTGKFYTRETYEKDVKANPIKEILLYKMPQEDAVEWLKLKGTTMASDGMAAEPMTGPWDTPWEKLGNMHPRGSGARALSLRLARENGIPLMHMLAILSYNAAKYLGDTGLEAMKVRGRIQEGMVADIAVFDPEKVTERSDYDHGSKPSTGFRSVIVNGVQVVKNDRAMKVFPGQPIRHKPASEPKFEPVSVDAWKRAYDVAVHAEDDCLAHPSK